MEAPYRRAVWAHQVNRIGFERVPVEVDGASLLDGDCYAFSFDGALVKGRTKLPVGLSIQGAEDEGRHTELTTPAVPQWYGLPIDRQASGGDQGQFRITIKANQTALVIAEVEGEARVLDTDLGSALGMARPTNIRTTIEACRSSLEAFGPLHSVRVMVTIGSGARRVVTAFHLNEEQAVYVTIHCRTERAEAVKVQLVKVFTAWRRGARAPVQAASVALPNFSDPIAAAEAWIEKEKARRHEEEGRKRIAQERVAVLEPKATVGAHHEHARRHPHR